MSNPSRQKGTGGETELLRLLKLPGLVRTPASSNVDLARPGWDPAVRVLATRPDRGQWLITMDVETFCALLDAGEPFEQKLEIEVKRYKRFSLHGIFESKFGGSK